MTDGLRADTQCRQGVTDGASPNGRRALLANGYEPLPICGKGPRWPWRTEPITEELLSRIESDPNYADHQNTGLRTGALVGIDIDVRDRAHVQLLKDAFFAALGFTDVQRVGAKGVLLCYYNPNPIRKLTIAGKSCKGSKEQVLVEFLGEGQQAAAYGIHPITGSPYQWPYAYDDGEPLQRRLSELRSVSPEMLQAAARCVAETLTSAGYLDVVVKGLDDSARRPSARSGEPVPLTWIKNVLSVVPASVPRSEWLSILWAIKEANIFPCIEDAERIDLLDNWSSGDLGGVACDNYRGYRDVAYSYDWAKGTGDNLVTVGTMFAIAKKYGFAGGPPYVRLMGLANDETDAGERIKPPAPVPESRWPKLTRRGRAIIEMRPAGMIVPGWLRDTGFTGILANRGTGKTVVAVGLALCIAADKKWMGEPVARGFHAIYLCGEDQENTSAHIEAWCNRNNAGEIPDRFVFIEDVPDLMNADDCAPLIAHIGSLIPSGTRAVIVADTWQRATSSARDGQNSDRDMAAAAENLEVIAKAFCGAAVACFHPPKGQKAMGAPSVHGSAVIENTSTGIWTLGVDEAGAKLEVTRIKGPGLGNYKRIRLETESLARADAFGREVTGKVAEHIGGTVSSLMDEAETERLEKEAVFRTVRVLLKGGLSVLRSNGEGQKPADVAEEVFRREGIKLDKKTVLKHLNALEREGRLIYIAADRNRRVKAGFRLPHDCTAEAADECMPKASPNAVEGIFKTQEMPAES